MTEEEQQARISIANNVQLKQKACRTTVLTESQLHPIGFLPLEQIKAVMCVYVCMQVHEGTKITSGQGRK